ncbi:uncharacterized protein NPIL_411201 [Nephila pilipes]|uniref:PH domain-containing protein n=1 Tax=Nephila pilipes TaxID=299642 RepID=A0A8X6MEM4_NEPPI|nr:uncharacterized protein NPIL_411201 [Nephila pilipes]
MNLNWNTCDVRLLITSLSDPLFLADNCLSFRGRSASISEESPFAMEDSRYRLLREGPLDIKPPPDSPERILHKAWRRLWIRAIIFSPQNRGEPHLILQLARKAKDDEPLKQVKASRDGLRLFRCSSGSRALRCWAITSGSSLLLYLAADSEKETQDWMYTLREGLWPTVHSSKEDRHEISLIDDEKSFASGLLGVYGHLVKTSEGVLRIIHPHWQGTQMRWRLQDIVEVKLIRKVDDAEGGHSGVFTLTVRSTNGEIRVLQFYSNTAIITVDWIKSLLSGENKDEIEPNKHSVASLPTKTETTMEATASYATVKKTGANTHLQDDVKAEEITDLYGKVNRTSETQLSKIPHSYLNASTNCVTLKRAENSDDKGKAGSGDDSDDSSTDMYDHVYEDLDFVKDSRTYTLYEEIDDESEYVPPEPPILPARLSQNLNCQKVPGSEDSIQDLNGVLEQKQESKVVTSDMSLKKSLHNEVPSKSASQNVDASASADVRLQKLCESVSEALKLAEEPTVTVIPPKRPSLLRKVVGKSKSHQVSPIVSRGKTSARSTTLKRTVSEPDLVDAILDSRALPLQSLDSSQDKKERKEEEMTPVRHVPLEEMLKDLKPANRKSHQQHRRGVSEGGKMTFVTGKPVTFLQIETEKVSSSSPAQLPDQTEAEYIHMS